MFLDLVGYKPVIIKMPLVLNVFFSSFVHKLLGKMKTVMEYQCKTNVCLNFIILV